MEQLADLALSQKLWMERLLLITYSSLKMYLDAETTLRNVWMSLHYVRNYQTKWYVLLILKKDKK